MIVIAYGLGFLEFWVWVLIGCGLGLVWRGRICCLYGCARCCLLTAISCSLINSVDFVILCPFVLYVFMWLGLFLVCGGMLHVLFNCYCFLVVCVVICYFVVVGFVGCV